MHGVRHPGLEAWNEHGRRGQGLGRDGATGPLKDKPADDEAAAGD